MLSLNNRLPNYCTFMETNGIKHTHVVRYGVYFLTFKIKYMKFVFFYLAFCFFYLHICADMNYQHMLEEMQYIETDQEVENVLYEHGFDKEWWEDISYKDKIIAI